MTPQGTATWSRSGPSLQGHRDEEKQSPETSEVETVHMTAGVEVLREKVADE